MNITKQKQTHRYGEQTSFYQWEEDQGRGLLLLLLLLSCVNCVRLCVTPYASSSPPSLLLLYRPSFLGCYTLA